jgi:PAS domain S-box-containing protein
MFSSGRPDKRRRTLVVALSAVLFAALFALRVTIEGNDDAPLLFFVIPVVLLAMEFEYFGGLLGALAAAGMAALYGAFDHLDLGALGYVGWIAAFILVGGVVGGLARRLRHAVQAHERAAATLRTEAARRESEGLKSAILDSALDCVIMIDHTGHVLEFNAAAQETFGYGQHEAVGRELAELIVPPELRARHREALARYGRARKGHILDRRIEMPGMRKDGATFPVELTVTRVPGAEPPVFAGYLREISERKRAEERARSQSREIAKLAEERGELVAQLLLAEERTRRRIAQELHDDALQRLLAAHQDLIDAAPGRKGVMRAHEALEGTIDCLRDAVGALHPVTLQEGDLESALGAIAREQAAHGGFRYTVRVEDDATGHHDGLVLSVARELLTNIANHARASRCSVSVARKRDRISLEVADDGRGIPPGRREIALHEGHVGLASAVQRLKAIGGDLEISSEPGKGTLARGHIPIAERQHERTDPLIGGVSTTDRRV